MTDWVSTRRMEALLILHWIIAYLVNENHKLEVGNPVFGKSRALVLFSNQNRGAVLRRRWDGYPLAFSNLVYDVDTDTRIRERSLKTLNEMHWQDIFAMLSSVPLLAIVIPLVVLIPAAWFFFYRTCRNAPFPPGPRGIPLAGNLLDMPSKKEWLTFAKWGEIYGDMLSVSILGHRIVVINSAQMAIDMLDKKALFTRTDQSWGWLNTLVLLPYGTRFRNQRRLAHQQFGSHEVLKQFPLIIEHGARGLLRRLSANPEHLSEHIRIFRRTTGAIFFANLIPILRHIPDWFPGPDFKQIAKEWRSTIFDMVDRTHGYAAGNAPVSFTSKLLEDEPSAEEEIDIKWLAATLYGAISAFFKAMLLFPDVQAKAQGEIDLVIGNDRLPRSDDRERLPYINALVLEVSRWHTVAPLGVPHSVSEDDVQSGFFIPKGTLVVANIWKMLHDPAVYKRPFNFNPDRFIRTNTTEPETDPYKFVFGFGRRIFGDDLIFNVCVMVLAVFNISKYSENGVVLEPDSGHTAGNISHPTPFKCMIQARSEKALNLINERCFV
ncbi:cytochrome P450 [Armillaria solidipes]|uniref:Cytochrome P450 n=1 Tax=Armillaria solidipes TaxID=1076256 RepID=A0A2H3BCW5_9AGAR|nr:cytochrome P450 [Armillaria solidipes]